MNESPRRIHAISLIGLGAMMSIMMTTPVLPLYLAARGLPPAHVGAVIGVMSLALAVAEVMVLWVTARLGRRRTVLTALGGGAVMLAWFPFVGSLLGFYVNRIANGAVRGLLWPVMFAEVAEQAPPQARGSSFAIFWLYFGFGTLIGPAVGGILGERISLVAPFYAAAAVSLLVMPLGSAIRPLRDTVAGNPFASYAVLLRTFPAITRTWALAICNVVIFGLYSTFLPLHAAARGLSATEIGFIFTGGAVSFIIGQDLLRRLSDRLPPERLLAPAVVARGLGVAIVPFLPSFPALLAVNFLSSLIGAAVPLALTTRIAEGAPRDHLVTAMGGFNASADLGFFLGPVAGGLIAGLGLRWAFFLTLPVIGIALFLLRNPRLQVVGRGS